MLQYGNFMCLLLELLSGIKVPNTKQNQTNQIKDTKMCFLLLRNQHYNLKPGLIPKALRQEKSVNKARIFNIDLRFWD